MRNLIGMVTFGNLQFTQLALQSMNQTTKNDIEFFIIVGKPGDRATKEWLESMNIPHKVHSKNMGFPYSLNDIYDYAWKENNFDTLILAGNDIVAYPYCIDSLINLARDSEYECISATQYDVKNLVQDYPEVSKHFSGEQKIIKDFNPRPWEAFTNYSETLQIEDMQLFDIQNLCLYKKSVFDKVGYTDVAFYPAYFVDNDYALRMVRANIKCCSLSNARFFHFWSRTINQETGGSTPKNFQNNSRYYVQKWGGSVGKETKSPNLYIGDRSMEEQVIDVWRTA